jgi:hypothetical protein
MELLLFDHSIEEFVSSRKLSATSLYLPMVFPYPFCGKMTPHEIASNILFIFGEPAGIRTRDPLISR